MYEWLPWVGHYAGQVPADTSAREKWLHDFSRVKITPSVRQALEKWYGKAHADAVEYAEAFEICEYGAQPDDEQKKRLFPMLQMK